jgi:hypothetical protein
MDKKKLRTVCLDMPKEVSGSNLLFASSVWRDMDSEVDTILLVQRYFARDRSPRSCRLL